MTWNPFAWFVERVVAHGEARAQRATDIEQKLTRIEASVNKLNAELTKCETQDALDECKLWIEALNVLAESLVDELNAL